MGLRVATTTGSIFIPSAAGLRPEMLLHSNGPRGIGTSVKFVNDFTDVNGIALSDLIGISFNNGNEFVLSDGYSTGYKYLQLRLSASSKSKWSEYFGTTPPDYISSTYLEESEFSNHFLSYNSYTEILIVRTKNPTTGQFAPVTVNNVRYLDGTPFQEGSVGIYPKASHSGMTNWTGKVVCRDIVGTVHTWNLVAGVNSGGGCYDCSHFETYSLSEYLDPYTKTDPTKYFIMEMSRSAISDKIFDIMFGPDNWRIELDDGESIYSPGGDTADPHNPYSTPIVDPLNSGETTSAPNTDGTWTLPFDTVLLDHARVDSSQVGVYRLVGLTQQQLSAMADYMFSDTSVTEAWENLMKLIYGNVTDTIIGIQEFPMDVADSVGTDIFCFIGRDTSTGMFVGKALTSEYRSLDFGSIEVPRYSGTFYDFEPYTTLTLYIPYVGYIDMKPTEVVGSTLYISGYVHLSTGEVTINVRSSRTGLLGSYSGNIGRNLPISSADSTRLYAAIIETAAGLGGYATFGAGVSAMGGIEHADPHNMNVARGEYAQSVKAYGAAKRGVRGVQATMLEKQAAYEQAKEEFSSAKTAEKQQVQAAERAEREFNEAGLEAYSNAIDAVTSGFEVVRGTHMTPGAGRTSPQVCFLRIEVPHQNVSKNQKLLGYPCNSAEVLNSDKLHGYTELRMIDLQIPGITLTELQELESILKGGFYLP